MNAPPALEVTLTGQQLTISAVHDVPTPLGQRFRGTIEPNGTGSRITGHVGARWWGRANFAVVQSIATFLFALACIILVRAPRPLGDLGMFVGVSSLIFFVSWLIFYIHWRAASKERAAILALIERSR